MEFPNILYIICKYSSCSLRICNKICGRPYDKKVIVKNTLGLGQGLGRGRVRVMVRSTKIPNTMIHKYMFIAKQLSPVLCCNSISLEEPSRFVDMLSHPYYGLAQLMLNIARGMGEWFFPRSPTGLYTKGKFELCEKQLHG